MNFFIGAVVMVISVVLKSPLCLRKMAFLRVVDFTIVRVCSTRRQFNVPMDSRRGKDSLGGSLKNELSTFIA